MSNMQAPFSIPLDPASFKDALYKGQGRAAMQVRHLNQKSAVLLSATASSKSSGFDGNDETASVSASYVEALIHACLNNLSFDPQTDEPRAEWLLDLLTEMNVANGLAGRFLAELAGSSDFWNISQLADLAVLYAERGVSGAREALYEKFDKQDIAETWLLGLPLVRLDGMQGLLHVANKVGEKLLAVGTTWEDSQLLDEAKLLVGETVVLAELEKAAADNRNIAHYMNCVANYLKEEEARQRGLMKPSKKLTGGDLMKAVDNPALPVFHFATLLKQVSAADIAQIFENLCAQEDGQVIKRYLRVFRWRPFPMVNDRLLALAGDAKTEVDLRRELLSCFALLQERQVRDLALQLLNYEPVTGAPLGAIRLLQHNYMAGDSELILNAVQEITAPQAIEDVCLQILEVTEEVRLSELSACLYWVYEHSPVPATRQDAFAFLCKFDTTEEWLIEEAKHDVNETIRDLAVFSSTMV